MTRRVLGFNLHLADTVYAPAEDSLLLADNVQAPEHGRALDLCTGSGVVALQLARNRTTRETGQAHTIATDINPHACGLARRNARENGVNVEVVCTDLAQALEACFQVVACNPPYLPTAEDEHVDAPLDRALAGGDDGTQITRRVLHALPDLLAPGGTAWLVVSSLQPLEQLEAIANSQALSWETIDEVSVGRFERLAIVELERDSS